MCERSSDACASVSPAPAASPVPFVDKNTSSCSIAHIYDSYHASVPPPSDSFFVPPTPSPPRKHTTPSPQHASPPLIAPKALVANRVRMRANKKSAGSHVSFASDGLMTESMLQHVISLGAAAAARVPSSSSSCSAFSPRSGSSSTRKTSVTSFSGANRMHKRTATLLSLECLDTPLSDEDAACGTLAGNHHRGKGVEASRCSLDTRTENDKELVLYDEDGLRIRPGEDQMTSPTLKAYWRGQQAGYGDEKRGSGDIGGKALDSPGLGYPSKRRSEAGAARKALVDMEAQDKLLRKLADEALVNTTLFQVMVSWYSGDHSGTSGRPECSSTSWRW